MGIIVLVLVNTSLFMASLLTMSWLRLSTSFTTLANNVAYPYESRDDYGRVPAGFYYKSSLFDFSLSLPGL